VKVLIEVSGGVVQAVAATPGVDVMLVDWDNIEAGDPFPEGFDYGPTGDPEGEAALLRDEYDKMTSEQ
jgi:hypothetical protein